MYLSKEDPIKTSGAKSSQIGKATFSILDYHKQIDFQKFADYIYPKNTSIYLSPKYLKFKEFYPGISNLKTKNSFKIYTLVIFDLVKFMLIEFAKSGLPKGSRFTLMQVFTLKREALLKIKFPIDDFFAFLERITEILRDIQSPKCRTRDAIKTTFIQEYTKFYRLILARDTPARIILESITYWVPAETKGKSLQELRSKAQKAKNVEKANKYKQLLFYLDIIHDIFIRKPEKVL